MIDKSKFGLKLLKNTHLVTVVLPDVVKFPKLTADWENALTLVAKGEYSMQEFMGGIEDMVGDLVHTYHSVSDEQKFIFGGGGNLSRSSPKRENKMYCYCAYGLV